MTDLSKFKVAKAFKHLDPNRGLADGIAPAFPSIRYRGKQWSLSYNGASYPFKREDDGSPLTFVDVIILGISPGLSKAYFGQEAWTEESATAPICTSLKGDVPDPGVPVPQSKSCGLCSHNEWITKPTGGRGKECQDHKRMAVLLMPTMTKKMLGMPLMDPVHLKIPPGSLKSLKLFSDELQGSGIPFSSVVTRVAFSTDKIFQMTFEVVQALTDAEAPLVLPLMESNQTRNIMGSTERTLAPPPPLPPAEKVDTGLAEAFGIAPNGKGQEAKDGQIIPPPRPRGRRGAVGPSAKPPAEEAKADAVLEELVSDTFEESDDDLDATVANLMKDKMGKMLK